MKVLFHLILLIGCLGSLDSFCQSNYAPKDPCSDSLIHLDGYFVRVYNKKDIREKERQRSKRIDGRPFIIKIDGEGVNEFFIQSDTTINASRWAKCLSQLFQCNQERLYLGCSSAHRAIFQAQFCINEKYREKDTCTRLVSNRYYCLDADDSKYCYQIFRVSGGWLKGTGSRKKMEVIFPRQISYISPSVEEFDVYLLDKLYKYIPDAVEGKELFLWKEVPSDSEHVLPQLIQ